MVRPQKNRIVAFKPDVSYFKPRGIPMIDLTEVNLTVDERESIRLADLIGMSHEEAGRRMGVSRATFGRIVQRARKAVADALINGKAIKIEGGNFKMVQPRGRRMGRGFGGPSNNCLCPKCGYKEVKVRGIPCIQKTCPKCNTQMVRGD